jgi:hypothetical protein
MSTNKLTTEEINLLGKVLAPKGPRYREDVIVSYMKASFLPFCLSLILLLSPAYAGDRSDTARTISMTCGGTKIEIVCGYNEKPSEIDDRVCSHNTLTFTLPDGKVIAPPVPESHDPGSTPVGLSCEEGKDRSIYLLVEYLNGSHSCSGCHFIAIFNPLGERLSKKTYYGKIILEQGLLFDNILNIEGNH